MGLFNSILPYLSPIVSPDWTITKNVKYGYSDSEIADLYLLNKGVHPAMIFIHGGGWSAGDKSAYEGRARKYALAGFHVIAINYRLATADKTTQWPAQLEDCQLAVRWVRGNAESFRIDPNRIGVGGDSAGAHLALMLGADVPSIPGYRSDLYPNYSSVPTCILDMFGPCDLTKLNMRELIDDLPLFGWTPYEKNPEIYKEASPYYKLTSKFPSTCIIHGEWDQTVPFVQSMLLSQKLTQLGVRHTFYSYNGGHETDKASKLTQLMIEMNGLSFMTEILKP